MLHIHDPVITPLGLGQITAIDGNQIEVTSEHGHRVWSQGDITPFFDGDGIDVELPTTWQIHVELRLFDQLLNLFAA